MTVIKTKLFAIATALLLSGGATQAETTEWNAYPMGGAFQFPSTEQFQETDKFLTGWSCDVRDQPWIAKADGVAWQLPDPVSGMMDFILMESHKVPSAHVEWDMVTSVHMDWYRVPSAFPIAQDEVPWETVTVGLEQGQLPYEWSYEDWKSPLVKNVYEFDREAVTANVILNVSEPLCNDVGWTAGFMKGNECPTCRIADEIGLQFADSRTALWLYRELRKVLEEAAKRK